MGGRTGGRDGDPGYAERLAQGGAGDLRPVGPAGLGGPAGPAGPAGLTEEWTAGPDAPAGVGLDGLEWTVVSVVEEWAEVPPPAGETRVSVPAPASEMRAGAGGAWTTGHEGRWAGVHGHGDWASWPGVFATDGWGGPVHHAGEAPGEGAQEVGYTLGSCASAGAGIDAFGGWDGQGVGAAGAEDQGGRDGSGGSQGEAPEGFVVEFLERRGGPARGGREERDGTPPVEEDVWVPSREGAACGGREDAASEGREDAAPGGAARSAERVQDDWADPEITGQEGSLFHVRLAFGGDDGGSGDGAAGGCCRDGGGGAEVLASVSDGRITIEELRARPPLPLANLAALAARIEGPLNDAVRGLAERHGAAAVESACRPGPPVQEPPARRGRPSARRGSVVRHVTAEAYREALDDGEDPVLAVMRATGHSRRKSLRLIAGARDAGLLMPRHHRR